MISGSRRWEIGDIVDVLEVGSDQCRIICCSKFSATIRTDDLAVVGCLRALIEVQPEIREQQYSLGGTKDADWKRDKHHVTFRSSIPQYRDGFLAESNCLCQALFLGP